MAKNKKERPKICRITKLDGFDHILVGRDFASIFEEGAVYSVIELEGVIMINKLGRHAKMEHYSGSSFNHIITRGAHLHTEEEWKLIQEAKKDDTP